MLPCPKEGELDDTILLITVDNLDDNYDENIDELDVVNHGNDPLFEDDHLSYHFWLIQP